MPLVINHTKTNTVPDWTQPQLDTVIAGGAPPLIPAGTLLSNITLPSDWNSDHQFTGVNEIVNGGTGADTEDVDGTSVYAVFIR